MCNFEQPNSRINQHHVPPPTASSQQLRQQDFTAPEWHLPLRSTGIKASCSSQNPVAILSAETVQVQLQSFTSNRLKVIVKLDSKFDLDDLDLFDKIFQKWLQSYCNMSINHSTNSKAVSVRQNEKATGRSTLWTISGHRSNDPSNNH